MSNSGSPNPPGLVILRATVGSKIHGLNLAGHDDTDEMGVIVEPPELVIGIAQPFETYVWRTQAEGVPSGYGDLDLTIYGLRKYLRLALSGNPTILLLLFVPPNDCSVRHREGRELQELAPAIVARSVAPHYLGYMEAQRQRLTGERGGRALRQPDKWGGPPGLRQYDTKFALHGLRLGYQGIELMQTGRLALPIREPERSFLMSVRRGEVEYDEVVARFAELDGRLKEAAVAADLPPEPDRERVQEWMLRVYLRNAAWL